MWEIQLFYWVGFGVITLLGGCGLLLFLAWLLSRITEMFDKQFQRNLRYWKALWYAHTSDIIKNNSENSISHENDNFEIEMKWKKKGEN